MVKDKEDKNKVVFNGVYVRKVNNTITVERLPNKEHTEILVAKDKKFRLSVGELYEFTCGYDKNNNLWLNDRYKIKFKDKSELSSGDVVKDDSPETSELELILPRNGEDYKQFHMDKRKALEESREFYKDLDNVKPEDVVKTAKYFFSQLNNNFGAKKEVDKK